PEDGTLARRRCTETLMTLLRKISKFSFPKDFPELSEFFASYFQAFAEDLRSIALAGQSQSQLPERAVVISLARRLLGIPSGAGVGVVGGGGGANANHAGSTSSGPQSSSSSST
ncbi:unnamed protein product, partial [Amoebophrya sp. A25]